MSESKSLYLKWRPTQIDDVVGQKPVVSTLKQAAIKKEFAHAYLLSGYHGCGKTTTARILSSLMQCENMKDGVVCGTCRACTTIHDGYCGDVIEIDGAANRGIDNVKNIIEAAQWSPQELKRKVYLIDEVHMLTKEAVSALLKTLEEPPAYLNFILCTTDVNKILPTILSRCQRFNFNKISSKDISQRLIHIAKNENIIIDDDATIMIAKIARGSMRDAIGYLEQIGTLAAGKKISAQSVQRYFCVTDRVAISNIIKTVLSGNISLIMDQVNDMLMAGVDCKQILFEISEMFRGIMVIKAQNGNGKLVDLPENEIQEMVKMGESLSLSRLSELAHLFADVEKKINFNINERWIMEATLIDCVALLRK